MCKSVVTLIMCVVVTTNVLKHIDSVTWVTLPTTLVLLKAVALTMDGNTQ